MAKRVKPRGEKRTMHLVGVDDESPERLQKTEAVLCALRRETERPKTEMTLC